MKNICILDTETTGLDPSKGKVIEVAAVFYNIPSRSIISQASTLLYAEANPAYEINRIEIASLVATPPKIESMGTFLINQMMIEADAIVAHNAEFDRKWMATIPDFQEAIQNKWICTKNDVVWPVRKGIALTLISICSDLGVPIINAHRALSDCLLLVGAIDCIDDIENFLDKSGRGRITYHAKIDFDKRQLVKDAGFQWDNLKKVWHAKLTPEIAATMPFPVYPAESNCTLL